VDRLLEATHRAEERHFWFRGFAAFVRPMLALAVAGVDHPRILDAGCGTGRMLGLLGMLGRCHGFDMNATGLSFAVNQGYRSLARATVTRVPFADGTFDLVTSFDVLYALEASDERRAIAEMVRVLKPGGRLLVNVAAMPILRGYHSVLAHEVRRYTSEMLRERLEGAGLGIVRLTYTNASLFPLLLVNRVWQRASGPPHGGDVEGEMRTPSEPLNTLLAALLGVEAVLARHVNMPFGSSLLCLARKGARDNADRSGSVSADPLPIPERPGR